MKNGLTFSREFQTKKEKTIYNEEAIEQVLLKVP